jgi:type I restriction enzyme S subunit
MDNFSCSEDVLRVVPDTNIIKSGYLYAYLSSRFGVPLIASGTYGAIVQHIEPEHITNLPVPRLGNIEDRAHELIQKAADLQVESTKSFNSAGQIINNQFGFPEKLSLSHRVFSCVEVSSTQILKRLDATYYDNAALESDRLIENVMSKNKFSSLNVSISENGRIKQVFVDEEFGVPFLTSREIFFQQYKPDRFLATNLLPDDDNWTVQEENILLARSGQVGGIIGRGVWADKRFTGCAVSVDVLRIDARYSEILPGYLYAYLCRTDVGYRQLIRTAAGSSIPHLSADDVYNLFIPRCDLKTEEKIDKIIRKAGQQRVEAQAFENEARALVERASEEGGR